MYHRKTSQVCVTVSQQWPHWRRLKLNEILHQHILAVHSPSCSQEHILWKIENLWNSVHKNKEINKQTNKQNWLHASLKTHQIYRLVLATYVSQNRIKDSYSVRFYGWSQVLCLHILLIVFSSILIFFSCTLLPSLCAHLLIDASFLFQSDARNPGAACFFFFFFFSSFNWLHHLE